MTPRICVRQAARAGVWQATKRAVNPAIALCLAATLAATLAASADAQISDQNPDWPCAQRLVDTLSAGSTWTGSITQDPNWRNDEALFSLVTDLADRDTPDADALAKLAAYADTIPSQDRAKRLPALFAALVDQTNDQRTPLIVRLEQLGRRQRGMGNTIAALSTQIDTTPTSDPHRTDLTNERDFDVQAFQDTQRTMRYACEAPPAMERRLGEFARVLQARLVAK